MQQGAGICLKFSEITGTAKMRMAESFLLGFISIELKPCRFQGKIENPLFHPGNSFWPNNIWLRAVTVKSGRKIPAGFFYIQII
jgi:hypothetical protein